MMSHGDAEDALALPEPSAVSRHAHKQQNNNSNEQGMDGSGPKRQARQSSSGQEKVTDRKRMGEARQSSSGQGTVRDRKQGGEGEGGRGD